MARHAFPFAFLAAAMPLVGQQQFVDASAAWNLPALSADDIPFGHGMCAAHFDGDGDLDLVVPQNAGLPVLYLRNDGQSFSDQSAASGLGVSTAARAVQAADIDNDGDQDLVIGNWHGACNLFINNGSAQFQDEAALRGLVHVSANYGANFGDYDRDGWLDLFIGNHFDTTGQPAPNILYRNVGGGFFVDVTAQEGVAYPGAATFFGVFFDYDEDGWPDLYCVNDKGDSFQPNTMFRNPGDGHGSFVDVGATIGAVDGISGMGCDFADVFNDGGLDFYVTDTPIDHLFRVWNPGLQQFTSEAWSYGLQAGLTGWACHFFDMDNDGWLDLHVAHSDGPNHYYRNPAFPAPFQTSWTEFGAGFATTGFQTVSIRADFDDDGRVDVLNRVAFTTSGTGVLRLMLNAHAPQNWLKVRTVGSVGNRDGYGAKVVVTTATSQQRQYVRHGVGFMAGNDPRVHFGLGAATLADVLVSWPSGASQRLHDVPANQNLSVTEPALSLRTPATTGQSSVIDWISPNDAGLHYAIMLAAQDVAVPFDGRTFPVVPDALAAATLVPGNGVLIGNVGALTLGSATAVLSLPNDPGLIGVELFAAALNYSLAGDFASISPALSIQIQ